MCDCGRRTADAPRYERSARSAAADFDPLRIRPYVTLRDVGGPGTDGSVAGGSEAGHGSVAGGSGAERGRVPGSPGAAHGTRPGTSPSAYGPGALPGNAPRPGDPMPGGHPTGGPLAGAHPAGGSTADTAPLPRPVVENPAPAEPAPEIGVLFPEAPGAGDHVGTGADVAPPRRRRRALPAAAAATLTAAVIGGVALATDLFSPDRPTHDTALPDTVTTTPVTPFPAPPASPSARGQSSAPAVATASSSAGPSASATGPTPASSGPSASAAPAAGASAPATTPPPAGSLSAATVLRPGDHGPQVRELQQRLARLNLYTGPPNGKYSSSVEAAVLRYQQARGIDDEPGAYGAPTRQALEAETGGA
ncbi:peptidoglycan-binding protein [Streptomyces sp. NPDC002004]